MAKSGIFRGGNRSSEYPSRATPDDSALATSILRTVTGHQSADATTNLPDHIGNYKILERIGRGERGVVYKAVDPSSQRRVAIKTVSNTVGYGQDAINTFTRDTDLAKRLWHSCIAPIHSAGFDDHKPYIVMDLLPGMDLLRFVRKRGRFASDAGQIIKGPTAIPEMQQMVLQIARGLSAAHHVRLFHGDLKPSHIWFTDKNQIKILDFGIAKLAKLNAQTHISDTTACQHDLFALGCIGYFLLSGQSPFRLGETDIFSDLDVPHPFPKIAPLATFRSDVPADMESLLMRLLNSQNLDAFSSVDEFLNAWMKFASPLHRILVRCQDFFKAQVLVMIGIVTTSLLAIVLLSMVSLHFSCGDAYKIPDPPALQRSGGFVRNVPPKADSENKGNWISPTAFTFDGLNVLEGKDDGIVREWDTSTGKEVRRWVGHEFPVCAMSLSANGRWLITADTSGVVYVWNHSESHEPTWSQIVTEGKILSVWTPSSGERMLILIREEEQTSILEYHH